jgi:phenylacetate-CoA ligase
METKAEISYWDKEIETLPREGILELQWDRLKKSLKYVSGRSPLYSKKFRKIGLDLGSINNLSDFKKAVPTTTKEELREERAERRDPYGGLLCVPQEEVVYLVRTGGTTGVPSIYGLTRKDVQTLGDLTARMWSQVGAKRSHVVALATSGSWNYAAKSLSEGLRSGGMNVYHYSMPMQGEEVFPIEILSQWMDIHGFFFAARPFLQVTRKYRERLKTLLPKLEYLCVAGQRMTNSIRRGTEQVWGGKLFEVYPITDVGLTSSNCTEQFETFHFPEDSFLLEVVEPETGKDLTGTGEVGEFVVTSLLAEGTPLVRFRTEDMGFTIKEPCLCGRTGMRIGLSERLAHTVRIGERQVFSDEVEEVLYSFPEFIFQPYHLVKKKTQPQERLILRVERPEGCSEDSLKKELKTRLQKVFGMGADVHLIPKDDERFIVGYKQLKVVTE